MNKSEIGLKIMGQFAKTNSKPEHILDQRLLNFNLFNKLNPKEQNLIEPAIQELVNNGLIYINNRAGGQCLVLTQKGFDEIYQINEEETISKIKSRIMRRFEEQNSRPSHVIQTKWISLYLLKDLNPKEQDFVNLAINELIENELVLFENRSGMDCLVLTEKGFETLYN